MTVINCLVVVPVIWVIVSDLAGPGPVKLSRALATAALVALPLCGTIAITIAGSAVLSDD